ncbi:MAG: dipeptidase [Deltaproteobacteria bacterium]|nr:dipeptidase [Deltaproteobacteria bacterium]
MKPYISYLTLTLMLFAVSGCASMADRLINRVRIKPPYRAGPAAQALHRNLFIVDLHADTLLWKRDILVRSSHGHVDLPRLKEGQVGLQVFSVVTQFPLFIKLDGNSESPDAIKTLTKSHDWPKETHSSRMARALYQAEKLHNSVRASNGELELITGRDKLENLILRRSQGQSVVGAMLALEGAHALEGKPENLDRLFEAGFRILGLAHFIDNELTGSAHGKKKGGLTPPGREVVSRAEELGMIIDLAHASPQAIDEILGIGGSPLIVSHTGVRGTCDTVRNLSDHHLKGIAARGGVIGIGLFKHAVCGKKLQDTVKAMRYLALLVGVEHVALGSDFDGSTAVVDAAGLVLLTEAMIQAHFTEEEIRAILGGNMLRLFEKTLPES